VGIKLAIRRLFQVTVSSLSLGRTIWLQETTTTSELAICMLTMASFDKDMDCAITQSICGSNLTKNST